MSLDLNFFFHFLTVTKKKIDILTKICAKIKIAIIVVENREPYYFILLLFVNVRKSQYPYFLIRYGLQHTTDERSIYYKVYGLCERRNLGQTLQYLSFKFLRRNILKRSL